MKFAHLADCHIGSWRYPKLRELVNRAFSKAIDHCIQEKVDFVLIAGDLFNTALPSIETMGKAVKDLAKLKDNNIPVYLVAGSHDYAASGNTMLDVLEETGIFMNVCKGQMREDNTIELAYTVDEKTGAHITGVLGKAGMLDQQLYKGLQTMSVPDNAFKIFLFHTAIRELMGNHKSAMHASALSLLPKHFDYYAGGHVHIVKEIDNPEYGKIVYPGPLFPASFSELEELSHGGFFIYDDGLVTRVPLKMKPHVALTCDVTGKTAEEIKKYLKEITPDSLHDTLVTLRIRGELGVTFADIQLDGFVEQLKRLGAYAVLRNTAGITVPDVKHVNVAHVRPEDVEEEVLESNKHNIKLENHTEEQSVAMIKELLDVLSTEKQEGETNADYEKRLRNGASNVLGLD